jgi:hypothetical protein
MGRPWPRRRDVSSTERPRADDDRGVPGPELRRFTLRTPGDPGPGGLSVNPRTAGGAQGEERRVAGGAAPTWCASSAARCASSAALTWCASSAAPTASSAAAIPVELELRDVRPGRPATPASRSPASLPWRWASASMVPRRGSGRSWTSRSRASRRSPPASWFCPWRARTAARAVSHRAPAGVHPFDHEHARQQARPWWRYEDIDDCPEPVRAPGV